MNANICIISNKCLDCQCFGVLRKVGDQVILFTEEILTTRSIHTQEADLKKEKTWKEKVSLAEHGFGSAESAQIGNFLVTWDLDRFCGLRS